jgi:hypothetical protein
MTPRHPGCGGRDKSRHVGLPTDRNGAEGWDARNGFLCALVAGSGYRLVAQAG